MLTQGLQKFNFGSKPLFLAKMQKWHPFYITQNKSNQKSVYRHLFINNVNNGIVVAKWLAAWKMESERSVQTLPQLTYSHFLLITLGKTCKGINDATGNEEILN